MLLSALLLTGMLTTPLSAPVYQPPSSPSSPSPLSGRHDTDAPVASGPSSPAFEPVRQANPDTPVTSVDPRNRNHNGGNGNGRNGNGGNGNGGNGNGNGPQSSHAAPEIDPASATAALSLLTGGLLLIRGRRR
jgi:hypothetical protein